MKVEIRELFARSVSFEIMDGSVYEQDREYTLLLDGREVFRSEERRVGKEC